MIISPGVTNRIIGQVAALYGVPTCLIKSDSHEPEYVVPRHVAMWLCRQAGFSFPQIGRTFGARHHTTAMYACGRIDKARESDAIFRELTDGLCKKLLLADRVAHSYMPPAMAAKEGIETCSA